MKHLAIFGASGHGKVVADTALQTAFWNSVSFFDDRWPNCKSNGQWDVVGGFSTLLDSLSSYQGVIVAIGDNKIRERLQLKLLNQGAKIVTIIHPSAYISPNKNIGNGTVIFANAVVNTDAIIGSGCIINTGATIDHDCQLDDFVHISPGANIAGGVKIGARSWVGIGSSIIQEVVVASDVIVGVGSTVIHNISASSTVVGSPAKNLN